MKPVAGLQQARFWRFVVLGGRTRRAVVLQRKKMVKPSCSALQMGVWLQHERLSSSFTQVPLENPLQDGLWLPPRRHKHPRRLQPVVWQRIQEVRRQRRRQIQQKIPRRVSPCGGGGQSPRSRKQLCRVSGRGLCSEQNCQPKPEEHRHLQPKLDPSPCSANRPGVQLRVNRELPRKQLRLLSLSPRRNSGQAQRCQRSRRSLRLATKEQEQTGRGSHGPKVPAFNLRSLHCASKSRRQLLGILPAQARAKPKARQVERTLEKTPLMLPRARALPPRARALPQRAREAPPRARALPQRARAKTSLPVPPPATTSLPIARARTSLPIARAKASLPIASAQAIPRISKARARARRSQRSQVTRRTRLLLAVLATFGNFCEICGLVVGCDIPKVLVLMLS
mmetsp:Transcript_61473/g.109292  ORF Transcript_61473/g.109292 Transcript_61473/m.109292 type:complete len:397 (-) Transcript_61473:6-1196(-)